MPPFCSRNRALIFDYGGVLMRTESQEGRLRLARRFGMSTEALSEAVFGNEFIELAELGRLSAMEFGRQVGAQFGLRSDAEIQAFWDEFFGGDVLDAALVGQIRRWRRAHKTALLSNFSNNLLDYVHNRLGIGDCFDEIIVSARVGLRKPDRRIYELALQRLQVAPHQALFVDDMAVNVEGARAAGLHAVRFTTREAVLSEIARWLNIHQQPVSSPQAEAMDPQPENPSAIRNFRPGDAEAWLALIRACPDFDKHFFNRGPSLDALRMVVEHPNMDAQHNLFFAGRRPTFSGYAELWCASGQPRAVGGVWVRPDQRRRSLGGALLQRIEERAQAVGSQYLDISISEAQAQRRRFLEAHGFAAVHYCWHMELSLLQDLPSPRWPEGYGTRTFVVGQDERATVELENASFAGEWEYVPVQVGEIEGFCRSPSFKPQGVIFAEHGGQLVGDCWTWIDDESIEQMDQAQGAVWSLCVLPQHRGLGLGRALLLEGLHWLRGRGMTSAMGAVDGANERAQRLYKSLGCQVVRTDIWYRKPLSAASQRPSDVP